MHSLCMLSYVVYMLLCMLHAIHVHMLSVTCHAACVIYAVHIMYYMCCTHMCVTSYACMHDMLYAVYITCYICFMLFTLGTMCVTCDSSQTLAG